MTRVRKFEPVVQHADKKQQDALQIVAQSQNQVHLEQSKLLQLESYRTEYLSKQDHSQLSCSVIELQEFNRFLAQLDDTIKKQKDIIHLRERELRDRRASWRETRINSKVMHQVVENLRQEEQIEQQRSEQKAMDEFSQRKIPGR